MGSIYTVRLALGLFSPNTRHVLYVAPADRTTVVRDVAVTPVTATGILNISIEAPAGIVPIVYGTIEVGRTAHFELRQVLESGDLLVLNTKDDSLWVSVTGYSLKGVAT